MAFPSSKKQEEPLGPKAATAHASRLAQACRHRPKPALRTNPLVPPAPSRTTSPVRPAR